jgi:hypothetical protein
VTKIRRPKLNTPDVYKVTDDVGEFSEVQPTEALNDVYHGYGGNTARQALDWVEGLNDE